MDYKLFEFFDALKDPRRGQGQRHTFRNVMTIVIMAILTGEQGFRGFHRFAESNAEELNAVLDMKHGTPGYNTIRSVLILSHWTVKPLKQPLMEVILQNKILFLSSMLLVTKVA